MHSFSINNSFLQHDNDPKYQSKLTKSWLNTANIDFILQSSCSSDLNIIENVWNYLEIRIRKRFNQPKNIDELKIAIEGEWYKIPLEQIQVLFDGIGRHIKAVKKSKSGSTKY